MKEHSNPHSDAQRRDKYGWPTGDAPVSTRTNVEVRAIFDDPMQAAWLFKSVREALGTPNIGQVTVEFSAELEGLTLDQLDALKHLQSLSWSFTTIPEAVDA